MKFHEMNEDLLPEVQSADEGQEPVFMEDPSIEEFLKFVRENDLVDEALAIIDEITAKRANKGKRLPQAPAVVAQEEKNSVESVQFNVAPVSGSMDLKAIRISLKMNQKQFAEAIGVTNAYISLMENGKVKVSDKVRAKVEALQAA